MGAGGGVSLFDISRSDLTSEAASAGVTGTVTRLDDDDLGWKVFAGYRFHQHFAAEGFYVNLGEVSLDFSTTAPTAATISAKGDLQGGGGALVGMIDVTERFGLHAKAGAYWWHSDATAVASIGGTSVSAASDTDGVDPMLGIGASFAVNDNVGVRVEWERFFDTDDNDVDLITGSVLYRF